MSDRRGDAIKDPGCTGALSQDYGTYVGSSISISWYSDDGAALLIGGSSAELWPLAAAQNDTCDGTSAAD